jgi:hypothetical protein
MLLIMWFIYRFLGIGVGGLVFGVGVCPDGVGAYVSPGLRVGF